METQLTSALKALTHSYKPRIQTKMRTICFADEVPMPNGGIVDSIRFEDDYAYRDIRCAAPDVCQYPMRRDMRCHACIYARRNYGPIQILCTCYEVKISMSDFHSGHGKNFFGHENYFVVPKTIEQAVQKELSEEGSDVGILSLHGQNLRMVRPCKRREVSDEALLQLMYAAFKKQMKKPSFSGCNLPRTASCIS